MMKTNVSKGTEITKRLFMLVTCLLMLCAISITKHGSIFNHNLAISQSDADTATIIVSGNEIVVNSTNIAHDVHGYGGPVPLKIFVKDGQITQIEILENAETPSFVERVKKDIVEKYIGKTPAEARNLKVDAVSGATLSSRAVVETIGISLDELGTEINAPSSLATTSHTDIYSILALLTALSIAILPLFIKGKRYRTLQLLCNILFLGILSGTFVSYSAIVGFLANGFSGSNIALIILLITAFVYPLFGKTGYYCAWGCPFGSTQELIGTLNRRKINISRKWQERLTWFRQGLWCLLMLMSWSGIILEWMNYELFTAFIWQSAEWIVIALAIAIVALSLFINRPYCRFICPTGTLLKTL